MISGKLACLRLVHFGDDDPMSEVLCCGKVARGGTKMCWKKNCEAHDHATSKASLPCPMEKSSSGMHVFIAAGNHMPPRAPAKWVHGPGLNTGGGRAAARRDEHHPRLFGFNRGTCHRGLGPMQGAPARSPRRSC